MGEKRRGERFNPIFLAVQSIRAGGQLGKRALVPLHIPSSCNICLLLPTPFYFVAAFDCWNLFNHFFFTAHVNNSKRDDYILYIYTYIFIKEILKNRLAVKLITSACASRYIGASFWMRSILHFSRTYIYFFFSISLIYVKKVVCSASQSKFERGISGIDFLFLCQPIYYIYKVYMPIYNVCMFIYRCRVFEWCKKKSE